ncbi:hypothetical protein [Microbacterium phyllosphaerae]|uniref:hypothetical protein n=1 Tax=Microbacterium phyllosphaerae TaxID=124798 RepID=UPI003D64CE9D
MSGPAYGNKNRAIHRAVVDLAASYLDAEGITAITKRRASTISDALADDIVFAPDLAVEGVHLDVSSKLTHKLAEDLESAQRAAAINGTLAAGFVQWRGDKEIDQAYVVTSLAHFAKLIRGDHLTPP